MVSQNLSPSIGLTTPVSGGSLALNQCQIPIQGEHRREGLPGKLNKLVRR